jgi:hypothetical protein
VSVVILEFDNLLAILARLRPHHALSFMRFVLSFVEFDLTVLAYHFGMSFFVMLFLVGFRDSFATLSATIVHSGATNLMHAEFGLFYLSVTGGTFLSRLARLWYLVFHF